MFHCFTLQSLFLNFDRPPIWIRWTKISFLSSKKLLNGVTYDSPPPPTNDPTAPPGGWWKKPIDQKVESILKIIKKQI